MRNDRAFTLLEVVLAAALLAAVVVVCAQLLRTPASRSRPVLLSSDPHNATILNGRTVEKFDSQVGASISGRWIMTNHNRRIVLVWKLSAEVQP